MVRFLPMITRAPLLLVCLPAVLALAACGGGGAKSPPEVDRVVEAVRARNEQALVDLVAYTQMPCSNASVTTAETPRCRFGEAEGTSVEVVKYGGCEDSYLRRDDVPNAVQHLLDPRPQVYAAFKAPESWAQGDYAVVLTSSEQGRPVAMELVLENARIVELDFGCGETPEQKTEGIDKGSFVLGPLEPSETPGG